MHVVFRVRKTGAIVDKQFYSAYFCKRFIDKARNSKKIDLLMYPTIR